MKAKCSECGSTNIEQASIDGAAVRLSKSPILKKVFNTGGQILTEVCLDCGLFGPLRGDPNMLASMLK
ncbi:MAG: hypothetical protein K8T20_02920 [Planctomycetes bacterium]|nr:hypothetical protein [Planctomycetota bacterium]